MVVLASNVYNGLVAADLADAEPVDGVLPMTNEIFYKCAASGTHALFTMNMDWMLYCYIAPRRPYVCALLVAA